MIEASIAVVDTRGYETGGGRAIKAKARVKVIEAQEKLEKGKTLDPGLNSGSQIGFTKNLSFRNRTANNIQSINQNMNVLQLCDKNSMGVKVSDISDTFAKASPLHSAAVQYTICIIIIAVV